MDIARLKIRFIEEANALEGRLTALSDGFYRNPELGLREFKTSSAMQELLSGFGFSIKNNLAGMPTAFSATIGTGRPAIALLAEMDALPGIGHGCGHNIGGTASIGAAAALSAALIGELKPGSGAITVLGTPAEELGKGKIELLKAGEFDSIDTAMMVHCSSKRTVIKYFLGLARLNFTFLGKASHASAYPEEGINALDAAILTFTSINALRQQLRSDVRVHGIITEGGKAPNIIPERAVADFYVRARDVKELFSVKARVISCAEGVAKASGCKLSVTEVGEVNYPMKINNALARVYGRALEYLGLTEDPQPPMTSVGSSDVGNVSQVVPTIHPHVPVREGINIHTRELADATVTPEGHRALMEGVKCLGLTALDLLFNAEALAGVKKEFQEGA